MFCAAYRSIEIATSSLVGPSDDAQINSVACKVLYEVAAIKSTAIVAAAE